MPAAAHRGPELWVFLAAFALVTVMGFAAARWRRPETIHTLSELGLGGRAFGNWVTFFLLSGDVYTAYTFVAVPALVYGVGAAGFFSVPYTLCMYPLVFVPLCRFWSVSHVHGFVTPAEFVKARHGSPALALLVAVTGMGRKEDHVRSHEAGFHIHLTKPADPEVVLRIAEEEFIGSANVVSLRRSTDG